MRARRTICKITNSDFLRDLRKRTAQGIAEGEEETLRIWFEKREKRNKYCRRKMWIRRSLGIGERERNRHFFFW